MFTDDMCIEILRQKLKEKRFIHSLNVADEAKRLAIKYGADPEKAHRAGLLHDIMKNAPVEEQLDVIIRNGVTPLPIEYKQPKLFHAIAGALYVKERGICDDNEILTAIRYHTTGRAGMSLLEKVIYIADFTSAERDYDGADIMRRAADVSLEAAMLEGARYSICDVSARTSVVHPDTVDMYNELLLSGVEKTYAPVIEINI